MTLIVHELNPSVYQTVNVTKNTILEAVRPHIYRHNFPTGTIKVLVQDTAGQTIAESEAVNIADIGAENYFHGYVRFYINAYLKAGTQYRITIQAGDGYSFDDSAYCGVCNDFDSRKYPATYSQNTGYGAALDLEFWERTV